MTVFDSRGARCDRRFRDGGGAIYGCVHREGHEGDCEPPAAAFGDSVLLEEGSPVEEQARSASRRLRERDRAKRVASRARLRREREEQGREQKRERAFAERCRRARPLLEWSGLFSLWRWLE